MTASPAVEILCSMDAILEGAGEGGDMSRLRATRFRLWVARRRARIVAAALVAVLVYAVPSVVVADVLTKGTHSVSGVNPDSIGATHVDVSFPSRDAGLTLRGWLFRAPVPTGRSVVFVHGWQSNRTDTDFGIDRIAHDMLQHGYDALLFDLRSCGTSDGDRFTLAATEPHDLLGAVDFMRSRGYATSAMTVIGDSMGAATVLEAAPQLRDVAALVADSAFSELAPLLSTELPKRTHLPSFFNWGIETAAGSLFGVDPSLRPVDAVRSLPDRAFLFFHASGDDLIPVADATELRQASANPGSELVIVPAQGHVHTYKQDPAAYMRVLYAFVDRQIAGA